MKKIITILFIILLIGCGIAFGVYQFTIDQTEPNEFLNETFNHTTDNNIHQIDTSNTIENELPNNQINEAIENVIIQEPGIKTATPPEILENGFELPLNGASGYASISLKVYSKTSTSSSIIKTLSPGTGFQILEEQGNYWYILTSKEKGWVQSKYCMINLPDVLPSIIYDDTNSYSSIFMSSGKKLPNVTGKALYNAYVQNDRLGKKQYIMPIMYDTAKKVAKSQQLALKNNQSLKIYETFRPYQTQKKVATSLTELINTDKTVKSGIYANGWNKSWFIAQTLSNHQRGIALDVSLVDIEQSKLSKIGQYDILTITEYKECKMPTKMHELSIKAVTFKYGVDTQSKTAWKKVPFAKTMTASAKMLQKYFIEAGMYPISSEWWHFNDLDNKQKIGKNNSTGNFYISKCYSTIPK